MNENIQEIAGEISVLIDAVEQGELSKGLVIQNLKIVESLLNDISLLRTLTYRAQEVLKKAKQEYEA